jgi:hypothetical protein
MLNVLWFHLVVWIGFGRKLRQLASRKGLSESEEEVPRRHFLPNTRFNCSVPLSWRSLFLRHATCILQDSNHEEPYSSELPWSYRMPLHQENRASKAWDLPRDGLQCATCRVMMKYARGYLTVVRIRCYRKLANKLSGKEQLYTGRQWILEFESLLAIFDS